MKCMYHIITLFSVSTLCVTNNEGRESISYLGTIRVVTTNLLYLEKTYKYTSTQTSYYCFIGRLGKGS